MVIGASRHAMSPPDPAVVSRYRFDGFQLDARTGELWHQGQLVPLQNVPFRMLSALVAHPGELLSREELRSEIWPPDVHVDLEGSLATAARKVRQALGDDPHMPRFVETVQGRGFRFLAPVEVIFVNPEQYDPGVPPQERTPSGFSPIRRIRLVLVLGAGALLAMPLVPWALVAWGRRPPAADSKPAASLPSLVVLPTEVRGPASAAYLADAIPDTLTTLLGNSPGLATRLPPSGALSQAAKLDLQKAAHRYQVDFLVLSTVTCQADNLVLNVKVAEATNQTLRWSGQFEGSLSGYNQLARAAAERISRVLGSSPSSPTARPPTSAVELALGEGKHFVSRYAVKGEMTDFDLAKVALERALTLDPAQAEAAARLGLLWRHLYSHSRRQQPGALDQAEYWAAKSLQMNPRTKEGWLLQMYVHMDRSRPEAACDCAWKILALAPEAPEPHALLGTMAEGPGSMELALAAYDHSRRLSTSPGQNLPLHILLLCSAGRPQEALDVADWGLDLQPNDPTHSSWSRVARALALVDLGRLEEAESALKVCREEVKNHLPWVEDLWYQVHCALVCARGNTPASRAEVRNTLRRYLPNPPGDIYSIGFAGVTLAPRLVRLGMKEEAFALLKKAQDVGMGADLDWLFENPEMQTLRSDPRFADLVRGSRDACGFILKKYGAAKARGDLPKHLEAPLARLQDLMTRPL